MKKSLLDPPQACSLDKTMAGKMDQTGQLLLELGKDAFSFFLSFFFFFSYDLHHSMANRWGNSGNCQTLFFWAPKSLQMVTAAMKLKDAYSSDGKL